MNLGWLKRYLPRSLYGRAALILIVPIVTIQLVVSIVFIQRLYEDVTRQMTHNVLLELRYLLDSIEPGAGQAANRRILEGIAGPLSIGVEFSGDGPRADSRTVDDLSGRIVIRTLREGLEGIRGIDLATNDNDVRFTIATDEGDLVVNFPRRRVSAKNPHQLLVLMIFTGLLMTAIAYLFLRNQLRPIKRLAAASEAFGKGRTVPYHPSGAVEVRQAGRSFLDMRARIERQIEQRTLMLSGVSHDLRTPLTRLRLGLSMSEDSEETRAMLRDLDDMERLLDGFLSFARGDAADELRETDPVALAREAVERAGREGKAASLGCVEGEGVAVALRPTAVARALDNLVGNATRYGSHARLSVSVTARAVRYTVEDDGPGIPRDRREEAVRPFTRLEPARNQNRGPGVGLGLSIARDIARGHGGELVLGESGELGGLKAELILAR